MVESALSLAGMGYPTHFSASVHFRTLSSSILQVLISRKLVEAFCEYRNLKLNPNNLSYRSFETEDDCHCIRNTGVC